MTSPTRRRFRWSLRTMFVVVTLFGCWLGWNVNTVRERSRLRRAITADSIGVFSLEDYLPPVSDYQSKLKQEVIGKALNDSLKRAEPKKIAAPSLVRRWLGDEQAYVLVVTEEADFESAREWFPEATIVLVPESFKSVRRFLAPAPH